MFYSVYWLECIEDPLLATTVILEALAETLVFIIPVSAFDAIWTASGGTTGDGVYDFYLSAFLLTSTDIPNPPDPPIPAYSLNLFFWDDVVNTVKNIPSEDRPCPIHTFGAP